MKPVYFFTNGPSVYGAKSESHGQLPAFFTDQQAASRFGATMIPTAEHDDTVFVSAKNEDDLRKFLLWNEKSYVLLDMVAMTAPEMKTAISN